MNKTWVCIAVFLAVTAVFCFSNVTCCNINRMNEENNNKTTFDIKLYQNNINFDSIQIADSMENRIKINKTRIDSIIGLSIKAKYDSLINYNRDNKLLQDSLLQQIIPLLHNEEQLNNVLLDIRQETNNNLTKIETIVTLWMGLLALIGIFIPILIQINSRYEIEKAIKKFEDDTKKLQSRIDNMNTLSSIRCLVTLETSSQSGNDNTELLNNLFGMIQSKASMLEKLCDDDREILLMHLAHYKVLFHNLQLYYKHSRSLKEVYIMIQNINDLLNDLLATPPSADISGRVRDLASKIKRMPSF